MEKTGLPDRIYDSVSAIYNGRAWLDTDGLERDGRISFNDGLSAALAAFQEAAAEADLENLILCEYTYESQELAYCGDEDTATKDTLTAAMEGFKDALVALKILGIPESYRIAEQTYSHHKDCRYNGMPKDSFHWACNGQIARLRSALTVPGINPSEKVLLKQRLSNMKTALTAYCQRQQQVLGEMPGE